MKKKNLNVQHHIQLTNNDISFYGLCELNDTSYYFSQIDRQIDIIFTQSYRIQINLKVHVRTNDKGFPRAQDSFKCCSVYMSTFEIAKVQICKQICLQCLMNCFEELVLQQIQENIPANLDPHQYMLSESKDPRRMHNYCSPFNLHTLSK